MNNNFVPRKYSLLLKDLGYDQTSTTYYDNSKNENPISSSFKLTNSILGWKSEESTSNLGEIFGVVCIAPLWQEVFTWFQENYNLSPYVIKMQYRYRFHIFNFNVDEKIKGWSGYAAEENLTRIKCLKQLISIIKTIKQ